MKTLEKIASRFLAIHKRNVFNRIKFLDPESIKKIDEKGYFTIQLLSDQEVIDISNIYRQLQVDTNEIHTVTLHSDKQEVKKLVFEKLKEYFTPKLNQLISSYRVSGGGFYYKASGNSNNAVPAHQDWTLVDEDKYAAYNIWIPLMDVDKTNGAYHVIDGSHKKKFTYRGSNIPSACSKIEYTWDDLTYIPLKKGEAIVYDVRLIHATPPNVTSKDRISAVINVVPEEAQLIHCYMENKNSSEVLIYGIDEEFFSKFTFSFKHNSIPKGYSIISKEKYTVPYFDL